MSVNRLEREMSGMEVLEWVAFFQLEDERMKDADPENMSPVERAAYLKGAATAQRQ